MRSARTVDVPHNKDDMCIYDRIDAHTMECTATVSAGCVSTVHGNLRYIWLKKRSDGPERRPLEGDPARVRERGTSGAMPCRLLAGCRRPAVPPTVHTDRPDSAERAALALWARPVHASSMVE